MVDATTLKFIDEKNLKRNFGVSLPILTSELYEKQYEAFYQKKFRTSNQKEQESLFTMINYLQREKKGF